jgi:outer membrane immunogenic protein
MNKLITVGVALGAFVAMNSANAADLPFKAAPRAVAPAPAGYDWSGIYVGAHVGGGWATNDQSDPGLGFVGTVLGVPPVQTTDSSGILGGLQAGWNYQIGRFVLGTEVDFSWADVTGTSTTSFSPLGVPPGTVSFSRALGANTDWIGTSTVRLGYAHDRWMFYSKAGAAWAHTNYTNNWTATAGGTTTTAFTGTGDQTRVGWTVGFGAEWAFMGNWSAKLEYDFIDFGSKTATINGTLLPGTPGATAASFGLVNDQTISEVKFGVNYKIMPLLW